MNSAMLHIGYDVKKMPLGKLGDSTIKEAYTVLNKLTEAVKNNDRPACSLLSGEFYSLIPHDFGYQKMSNFILDTEFKIKEKLNMLETISDLKIASKLMELKNDKEEAEIDQNYKKLGCSIKPLDESSDDYRLITEYFNNTKGFYNKVQVGSAFEVVRPS